MQVFLETDRLLLRRFTAADADNLVNLDSDPEVMRFLNGGRPTPRAVIEAEVLPRFLACYEQGAGLGFWAAVEKSTGKFIGWFEFRPVAASDPSVVELGYRLRRAAWGKGYATEGAGALVRKGFTELGVQRVVATTMTVNTTSRRVVEKVGLKLVRTFCGDWPETIEGSEHGDVEYVLDKAEWNG